MLFQFFDNEFLDSINDTINSSTKIIPDFLYRFLIIYKSITSDFYV